MNKRRVLALAMIVALVSGLVAAGCPAPAPAPPAPAPPAPAPPAPAPPAPPPPVPVEVITWKFQDSYDAANPAHIFAAKFADAVTKASDGRLVVKSFTGGSIAPATKEVDAVSKGVIELTYTCTMYNLDKWPAAGLFSARPGGLSPEGQRIWFEFGGGIELLNKMIKGYNVTALRGINPLPPEIWAHSTVPINSLADIKGLRMRTAGDGGAVLTRMGASVVFLPGGELYEAIERGVIDAFEYSSASVDWAMSFQEIAHYVIFSETRAPSDPIVYYVSDDAWAELPSFLQQLVQDEVRTWTMLNHNWIVNDNIVAVGKFIDYGNELSHLPEDVERMLLEEAIKFYDEKAAEEEPIFGEILDSIRAFKKGHAMQAALHTPLVVID